MMPSVRSENAPPPPRPRFWFALVAILMGLLGFSSVLLLLEGSNEHVQHWTARVGEATLELRRNLQSRLGVEGAPAARASDAPVLTSPAADRTTTEAALSPSPIAADAGGLDVSDAGEAPAAVLPAEPTPELGQAFPP